MQTQPPLRIVLAKVGLDGHDRGIKVVARGLRDAGFHTIYAGLWQSPEAVVRTVAEEDADWLGLSILSGAHMTLVPRVIKLLTDSALEGVGVIVGGIVPEADASQLLRMGVARVFGPGTPLPDIAAFLREGRDARRQPVEIEQLLHRLGEHDRLALARLMTVVSRGEQLETVRAALPSVSRDVPVVALTGGAGVGKSTLIGKLIELLRKKRLTVAVLACDPESPFTAGALLADRVRMSAASDDGVFIRSLAVAGGQQGIAGNLQLMVDVLKSCGFDVVLLETVGAGQGDTAVRQVADVVTVLVQPQTGDELQWQKAGLLEIADVVVVHKADLPDAERVATQVHEMLNLPGCREVPVLRVSAAQKQGLEELWNAIASQRI